VRSLLTQLISGAESLDELKMIKYMASISMVEDISLMTIEYGYKIIQMTFSIVGENGPKKTNKKYKIEKMLTIKIIK
jgi:hypothetical protein